MPDFSKIAITGYGSISPLGGNENEVSRSYESAKTKITSQVINGRQYPAGILFEKEEETLDRLREKNKNYRSVDRSVLMAIAASEGAMEMAGWRPDSGDIAVNIGSSRGATGLFEKYHEQYMEGEAKKLSPLASPTTTLGNLSSWVAYHLKVSGMEISHSVTCSTFMQSVANGMAWLRSGMAGKFLAGATEAPVTGFTLAQMEALKIYASPEEELPSKPFAGNTLKTGMVLCEGSAVFALERADDASGNILALISGLGYATEIIPAKTGITTEGTALQKSMRNSLENAGLKTVDLIIAHAPGNPAGDRAEWHAISEVFGENIPPVTSNKWITGHSLGASSALSLEFALYILKNQHFPSFPYPTAASKQFKGEISNIMINSTGFGGNAFSLIISKF